MAVPGKKEGNEDAYLRIFCQPCDREGQKLPAFGFCQDCSEHLCKDCFNYHRKATPSRHHVLLDIATMPNTLQTNPKSDDLTQPCLKHKKKMIEFYCEDHKALLCSICVAFEHTGTSCHVIYIPTISGQIVDSRELKDVLEHMDALIHQCQKVKEECKKVTEKSSTSLTEVLKEIRRHREEINKTIDELENKAEKQAKLIQQQNSHRLQTTETICDDVTTSMKALSDNIKENNSSILANKLFIELKTAEVELKAHETCINELTAAGDVKAYHFKVNQTISALLKQETSLGTLEQQILSTPVHKSFSKYMQTSQGCTVQTLHGRQNGQNNEQKTPTGYTDKQKKRGQLDQQNTRTEQNTSSKNAQNTASTPLNSARNFSSKETIYVNTTIGNNAVHITGMAVLNPDQLVVTDYDTQSIKVVDINSKSVISKTTLTSGPWDITSVTSNQLAVTLPLLRQIKFLSLTSNKLCSFSFLSMTSNKLSHTHSLNVDGFCHGISYCQNKLVVTYNSPVKLEILDMEGRVLKILMSYANGENIFIQPRYVHVNSRSIYVFDSGNGTLKMFNWRGKVTGTYSGLKGCQGLALSDDGTVFVSEQDKGNIVLITDDCGQGNVVIKNLNNPQSMCWCDESRMLYIIGFSGTDDIIIYVFNES